MMDDLINKTDWKDKMEFYYVGNLPDKIKFNNTKLISPLSGKELSDFLSSCHIYLTGSINEPEEIIKMRVRKYWITNFILK